MAGPPEPPDERPIPPPPAPNAEGGTCPRCGTPYEAGQEYCLECGLRLPQAHGVVAALSSAWRRRIPWYPGDWIWSALLFLVIAALGAAFAILATRDNGESATKTRVGTTEPVAAPSTTSGEPPTATGTGAEPPPATAPPPPTTTGPGGLTEWPAGRNGWTVVLLSAPENGGREPALAAARKASRAGLTEVGLINSSEYSSLHPGYYVVFSGIYSTREEAERGLDTTSDTYPSAYVRQIAQ